MEQIDLKDLAAAVAQMIWFDAEPGATFLVGSWARELLAAPGRRPSEKSDIDIISIREETMVRPWARQFEYNGRRVWLSQTTPTICEKYSRRGPEHSSRVLLF